MTGMKDRKISPDEAFSNSLRDLEHVAENYQILLASANGQKAFEIDTLQGSFLSTHIYRALMDHISDVDIDEDGRITLDELGQWIQIQAQQYNTKNPQQTVPIPYTFGQRKGPFFITTEKSPWPMCELTLNGNIDVIAIPYCGEINKIVFLGRNLITNNQCHEFVDETGYSQPIGKKFDNGWKDSFPLGMKKNFVENINLLFVYLLLMR